VGSNLSTACDPENLRLFHMFWAGPFNEKPYVALLSFLFTQNLGLHLEAGQELDACRPQIWLWINPGPAAAVPNPSALTDMYDALKTNPWAAPFLHPRFKNVIKFKLWNTTEQLDSNLELRDEWRKMDTLFNSGGVTVSVPAENPAGSSSAILTKTGDMVHRLGSKSEATYDRLSVILSDMARFIVTHRYGGIYLDADTIFLRDWEELWGWKGAFAYRWSYHEDYNTAVLHLNKGSALGSFLFRTALKNGFDFHPVAVSKYLKEAHLENLLLRVPDALFDPAWLNTEGYQVERPTYPFFAGYVPEDNDDCNLLTMVYHVASLISLTLQKCRVLRHR
jgi:WD repeat and SOF domain-containing protein 1